MWIHALYLMMDFEEESKFVRCVQGALENTRVDTLGPRRALASAESFFTWPFVL